MSDALEKAGGLVAHGSEWQAIQEQAAALIRSGFMPRAIKTPAQAIAVMLAGRELGLPPMQSIRAIAIVDGKPTLSAETMLALAYQRVPGIVVNVETKVDGAVVTGKRPGGAEVTVQFTIEDAKAAGLLSKQNWRQYPQAMFRARAISAWCRVVAPDAILGAYTPEELESVAPAPLRALEATHVEAVDDPRPTQEELAQDIGPDWPEEVLQGRPELAEPGSDDGPPTEEPRPAAVLISEPQRKRLYAISKAAQATQGWTDEYLKGCVEALLKKSGFASTKEVTRDKYGAICDEILSWK